MDRFTEVVTRIQARPPDIELGDEVCRVDPFRHMNANCAHPTTRSAGNSLTESGSRASARPDVHRKAPPGATATPRADACESSELGARVSSTAPDRPDKRGQVPAT